MVSSWRNLECIADVPYFVPFKKKLHKILLKNMKIEYLTAML